MKIGEFAEKHNTTIDTVRHYMELGLIIPEKAGSQYSFTPTCSRDMEEVLKLKDMGFTLAEIRKIFGLKRLTALKSPEDMEYLRSLFRNKKSELDEKKQTLEVMANEVDRTILKLDNSKPQRHVSLGVPLELLSGLVCPSCRKQLVLNSGSICSNMVVDGQLQCACGYTGEIRDGIIITGTGSVVKHDTDESKSEEHYIEKTAPEYVSLIYRGIDWITDRLDLASQSGSTIIELGTGYGILLSHIIRKLPSHCLYICVDHDIELLKSAKAFVESNYNGALFAFICCDFRNIPLKDGLADMVIDYIGTTCYNFFNPGYPVGYLQELVRSGGKWAGVYLHFKPNSKSLLKYPPGNRMYLYLPNIIKALQDTRLKTLETAELGFSERAGVYEKFFAEGDRVYQWAYLGIKE